MIKQTRYTLYGGLAILLWSGLVGCARLGMEQFGPLGGAACLYSLSSLLLIKFVGLPKLRTFGWSYFILGSLMFASYEVLFSLSFGMANSRMQAIEVSIVNYLWPALTVLFAIILTKPKTKIFIYPSLFLAFSGVILSISGGKNLSVNGWIANVSSNPSVYLMALTGAFIWAGYCNLTKQQKNNGNLITVFFIVTAITLWVKFLLTPDSIMTFSWSGLSYLAISSIMMAGGYGLWNIAIVGGNMMFLATLSYFVPIFSAILSSLTLSVLLPESFWLGVAMVTLGSLMCWWSTREEPLTPEPDY
ncbi:EamA family transporter [Vibrio sp. HA2012]|uniref:aromatic amino acid DMT transporter YddG n=1 Tax=Vibrio sp. HA2012 TaxID=1971595 RepID=UPI000C2CAF63|nr:aromatic amino acid DMT transporter YddG [Vibrio sp. HA2012]PJC86701.1 EamA family transporter [Vibrio sp. HA2012]